MNFTAIDFETANSSRSSACAIGVAVVENSVVVDTFTSLIRPRKLVFSPMNISIHGICMEDVLDQPHFYELWDELKGFLEGQKVVCHNAGFDISVLRAVLGEYGLSCSGFNYYCTYQAARRHLKGDVPNFRLNTLADYFGIELEHHEACSDAVAAAYLAVEMARLSGSKTLGDMAPKKKFKLEPQI